MKKSNKPTRNTINSQKKQVTSNRVNQTGATYFNPYERDASTPSRVQTTHQKDLVRSKNNARFIREVPKKTSRSKKSNGESTSISKKTPTKKKVNPSSKGDRRYARPQTKSYSDSEAAASSTYLNREQLIKKNRLSKKQLQRIKKRRQRRFMIRLVSCMLITTLGVWGILELREVLIKPKVSYQVVRTGTIDNSKQLSGLILRNEQVIYSEEEGNIQYLASEGDKIKKDGTVYVLVDEEQLSATTQTQNEVDELLYHQAEGREELSSYQDQVYALDQEVASKFETFYDDQYLATTQHIYNLRNSLSQNVIERTSIYTKEQEERKENIALLKAEVEANIEAYQTGKSAPAAGIISYHIDGQEISDLSPLIEELDYKAYNKLAKATDTKELGQNYITSGDPIYKLVLDNKWYVVTYIDVKEEAEFTEGEEYTLDFTTTNNCQVVFKLKKKTVENEQYVKLIFETSDQIGEFLNLRYVNYTIGNKNNSGLKIPRQAIVEQNMLKIPVSFCEEQGETLGVYRQKGELTEFVPLPVQYTKEDMHYIRQDLADPKMIQINDILVSSADKQTYQVVEVESKQGVYVVNGKVAQFKEVEIEYVKGDYVLVKYDGSTQLKELDKIISNPKSIKVDQLLEDMNVQNE